MLEGVQGYLAHTKTPTPLGPPKDPRHRPTVGSSGGAVSYRRGNPVGFRVCGLAPIAPPCLAHHVQGSGFRVWGCSFWGLGFRVQGSGVRGLGFGVEGYLGFCRFVFCVLCVVVH